ncbi:hypothetical protein GWK47_013391 [Chionoecetes opilio]|uniref:Uncharacterized protein n=1 Tax=Chionoecetes opilio TaxID=41210 RepID=A0A8J5CNY6_CHIOP|nr:hypothetical protein GWK47_013391 [Chionoecetes opilio]
MEEYSASSLLHSHLSKEHPPLLPETLGSGAHPADQCPPPSLDIPHLLVDGIPPTTDGSAARPLYTHWTGATGREAWFGRRLPNLSKLTYCDVTLSYRDLAGWQSPPVKASESVVLCDLRSALQVLLISATHTPCLFIRSCFS